MRKLLPILTGAGALGLGAVALRRRSRRRRPSGAAEGAPEVVVVGAGFGGLTLARALADEAVRVTVLDRNNYHLFQPLLYQVATAALEPEEIAHAARGIFQDHPNVAFRMATVTGVDWAEGAVEIAEGAPVPFDVLVLAAGARTATFGTPGVEEHAFGLKGLEEAVDLRSHTIGQFERVEDDPTEIDRGALTFVLVGGGPTGVEMSGALVELFDAVLRKDFPRVEVDRARVVLVEAGGALLSAFDPALQRYTLDTLRERGVEVLLGRSVEAVEGDGGAATAVVLDGGERIPAQTVLWAAGVEAVALADRLGLEQVRGGRVVVSPDLSVPGRSNAFVIGDLAASADAAGRPHPQLAPVAMQQAEHVARQVLRWRAGHASEPATGEPFVYRDRGIMATIGRNAAVAELPGGARLTGWPAWQAWAWLHLLLLVGFRNRANVWVNWVYNYFTYDRSARLIMDRRAGEPAPQPALPPEGDGTPAEAALPSG